MADPLYDSRAELLLLIPGLWILLHLIPIDPGDWIVGSSYGDEQWSVSKVTILPAYRDQQNALLSVFRLENIPVNQAGTELLTAVPGIGPALARRIVEDRYRSGPFERPADLTRVRGIGSKRVEQFKHHLRFD